MQNKMVQNKTENNEFKVVRIKNRTCYYFGDIIKLKDCDVDNILIDGKSHENVFIYDISYKTLSIRLDKIERIYKN